MGSVKKSSRNKEHKKQRKNKKIRGKIMQSERVSEELKEE